MNKEKILDKLPIWTLKHIDEKFYRRQQVLLAMEEYTQLKLAEKEQRVKELEEFLKLHEKWETSVISENSLWWPHAERDAISGKMYDSFLELQSFRNKLLNKYQNGECGHSYRYYQDKKVCHNCGHTVYGDFRD